MKSNLLDLFQVLISAMVIQRSSRWWCANGFHSGAPCSSQYTMSPSAIFHGAPQNTQTHPPPYRFEVLDLHDSPVKSYGEGVYKVRLSGQVPFRGFLVQVRPSTKEGFPIGHLRAGEFVPDLTWTGQGVQIQPCPSTHNDSATHTGNEEKTSVELLWKASRNYGPVLFVITIVQTRQIFWTQWLPSSGFLLPDETSFKTVGDGGKQEGADQSSVTRKNPFTVVVKAHPPAASPIDTVDSSVVTSEPPVEVTEVSSELSKITPELPVEEIGGARITSSSTRSLFELRTVAPTIESITSDGGRGSGSEPSQTVPPEVQEGLDILRNETDFCADYPCYNNGTCRNVFDEDRYECLCTNRWTGKQCDVDNYCENHQCKNGAECINGEETYKCKCQKEWAGEFCERHCPSYLCDNGGTCMLVDNGRGYGCTCAAGWTGEKCRQEIDFCVSQPCENGGTCVHKFNGFQCQCDNGYMGATCRRPCQDIYGSCAVWNEEERCETMRASTRFFDTNCASTCKQCTFDNRTLLPEVPLPPVLDDFEFLIGRWTLNTSTPHRFPLDFTVNAGGGYHEEMVFSPTPVPMFGTPSINYSAIARNNRDASDVHINVGFLTLKPLTKPLKVSLMSTGNHGVTTIEEGYLNGTELNLTTQYLAVLPAVDSKAPAVVKRIFAIANEFLRETVERLGNDGQKDYFTKYYYKERKIARY